MKMGVKITISIIASLLVLILVFLGIYFLWPWNRSFFNNADKEFSIPGLDTKFCPQGMTQIHDQGNKYLISGYMTDGSPSRFYLVDGDTNSIIKYVTLDVDGLDFDGHVGGVTYKDGNFWTVCAVKGVGKGFRFTWDKLDSADNGSTVEVTSSDIFNTFNGADFVFTYGNYLWVGEFYKKDKYETKDSHRITTRSGETNPAVVIAYEISRTSNCGLVGEYESTIVKDWIPIPKKALSIRGLCQGIAVTNEGKFVLSTSWGLSDSNIYLYENVLDEDAHDTIDLASIANFKVPLWYLDNESLISTTNAPAMSEEVIVKNDRVYILFESACKKYRLFNRKRLTNVYSLPVSYLEK